MNELQIKLERLELMLVEDGYKDVNIVLQTVKEMQELAIYYTRCCTKLPTSEQLISDCRKRFKDLEGKGNLDYRSYFNGYMDSFSKNVISKTK